MNQVLESAAIFMGFKKLKFEKEQNSYHDDVMFVLKCVSETITSCLFILMNTDSQTSQTTPNINKDALQFRYDIVDTPETRGWSRLRDRTLAVQKKRKQASTPGPMIIVCHSRILINLAIFG